MNFIVIVSDTYRYDNLAIGGGRARTLDLDRFITQANLFENYYVSSFPTIPNRTDCITGRYTFPFHGWQSIDPEAMVLAQCLGDAGYVSQLLCDTPHLMRGATWFHRGFTSACAIRGQEGDLPFLRMNVPLRKTVPDRTTDRTITRFGDYSLPDIHTWAHNEWVWEEDRYCCQTARLASKWLEMNYNHDGFLLWVDMFDPHEPWDPPEYLVRWFDDSGYDGPPMIHPNYALATHYTDEELCNLNAHYLAEASLVSKWIGHILRKAEELGLMENTAIIFTTDHGHYLGEHGWVGKENRDPTDPRRCTLFREITHIPFVIHVPGVPGGRVFPEIVQPVDLMPTILDLAGAPIPEGVHGVSLAPLLRGEGGWERKYAFSSFALLDDTDNKKPFPSVTDGRYSYSPRGQYDEPELHDLAADPGELQNIARDEPQVVQQMHDALREFLSSLGTPPGRVTSISQSREQSDQGKA
jgi:arylsulfatase A-like enzyme